MSVKQERVAQIILKDVTDIIQFSLKDPSVGFVTITDVQVTNDYSYATIYVSFLGKEERKQAGLKPLAQLRADKALRPVERLQARLLAFFLA